MQRISNLLLFLALVFSALALSTTSAHLMEYPQKVNLDISTYTIINDHLYRFYAILGGAYCMMAIVFAGILTWLTRTVYSFRWNLAGFGLHICWLLSWLLIVLPVNKSVAAASDMEARSALWSSLRMRWEWGHIIGFCFHLLAFCFLIAGVLKGRNKHV